MRNVCTILLMLCGLSLFASGNVYAEPDATGSPGLGRLFLTPEWRAVLERQRQLNVQSTGTLEGDSIRLDGIVVRSSGKSTVWMNGQPQTESSGGIGVTTRLSRRDTARAILTTADGQPIELKVGATFDQTTGEKHGGLTDGEIRIHRHATRRQ